MSLNLAHNTDLEAWVWGRLREEHYAQWDSPPYIWDCCLEQETVEALIENLQRAAENDPVETFVPVRRWYQITEKLLEVSMKKKWLEAFDPFADGMPFASTDGESLFVQTKREECMKELQKTLYDEWLVIRGEDTGNRQFHETYNPKWFPCLHKMMQFQYWNTQQLSPMYPAWMKYNHLAESYEKRLIEVYHSLLNKYLLR